MAQDATGFGDFSISTRHIRQLPAMARRSWKQKCGTSMPAAWAACRTVVPAGTSTSWPLIVSFGMDRPLRRVRAADGRRAVVLDTLFEHRAEMPDQALDRPGRSVAERADRVAFDLVGDVEQHVDLLDRRVALHQPLHHAPHPARALAAGRALAAALVLVEMRQPRDR